MPKALIWGAADSAGSALVRTLKGAGWRVYGARRDESGIPEQADLACAFSAEIEYAIDLSSMHWRV